MNIGDGWTYRLRYVSCGKSECSSCNYGFGHGPYWYAYRRENGKVRSRYVGKKEPIPFVEQPKREPEPQVDRRWIFKGRMDGKSALRILGFTSWPDQKDLRARWALLVNQHHPDRGGDVRVCAAINVAYGYLKS